MHFMVLFYVLKFRKRYFYTSPHTVICILFPFLIVIIRQKKLVNDTFKKRRYSHVLIGRKEGNIEYLLCTTHARTTYIRNIHAAMNLSSLACRPDERCLYTILLLSQGNIYAQKWKASTTARCLKRAVDLFTAACCWWPNPNWSTSSCNSSSRDRCDTPTVHGGETFGNQEKLTCEEIRDGSS
jgi:hypothetical protein